MTKKIYILLILWGLAISLNAQTKLQSKVSGTVVDAVTQNPLAGVRVSYKNLSAAITDDQGKFTLSVPNNSITIQLAGDGLQTKELALKGQSEIKTMMNDASHPSVYDVVTMPTQNIGQNLISNSVGGVQVKGWGRISETPDTYLQGQTAGLNVVRRSGTPNAGATLWLRGLTSLNASTQPLIVVDGMIYDNDSYGSSLITNYYDNPLAHIDVRDIDNITILKDGATALYGTKGANGVILITTARAKELATRIDFGVFGGVNFAPRNIPMMNAFDYRAYLSDVLKSSGQSANDIANYPFMNDNPQFSQYYRYHNDTDWQKNTFQNNSTQNVYLKVTGGDNVAKYGLSLNYLKNQGALNATELARYNTRFNADLNLSKNLRGAVNLSFGLNEQELKNQGINTKTNPIYLALTKAPILGGYEVSSTGILSPDLSNVDVFNVSNPLVIRDISQAKNQNYRFLGNIKLEYDLSKNVTLGTLFGINFDKVKESSFVPRKGVVPDTLFNAVAFNRLASQTKRIFGLYSDSYVAYQKSLSQTASFNARLGARYLTNKIEQDFVMGYNSATDELVSVGNGVAGLRKTGGSINESRWLSNYLTTEFNFSDKYLLGVSATLDGSSKFGTDAQNGAVKIGERSYALMPSLSAAWVVSSEDFMRDMVVNFLKIRVSYGISGNDDIGNYGSQQIYVPQNLLGVQGLVRGNIANPMLQWETVAKANFGIDASFLNDRLSVSFDVFNHNVSNMLVREPAPTISGVEYLLTNSGKMRSSGFEASVNFRAINTTALKWDLGLNIASARSKVTALPTDQIITNTSITTVGQAPNAFYGYKTNGIYASQADAAQEGLKTRLFDGSLANFVGGDVRFIDTNGDKIIDEKDKTIIGNPSPKIFGGINNHLSCGNFMLDAMLTFVSGNQLYNYTRLQIENLSGYNNQSQAVNSRWRNDGQQTSIPRAAWGDPNQNNRFSDRWVENGSYLRLKTVSLSYNWPVNKSILKYVTAYVTANNVLTLSKYLGYDPEFSATNSIYGQGTDLLLEPIQKSCQIGLRIGL